MANPLKKTEMPLSKKKKKEEIEMLFIIRICVELQ
jgi:hypothetical protein